MNKVLLCVFLFCSYYCHAQNYNCLQYGQLNFFTNTNGYLRGIRVDSIRAIGADTVYYPYHTPRGAYGCNGIAYLDSNGGSWLGKNVLRQADGTYLFDNLWHDTVVIKTQASLGESWIFFNDTTRISYKATVISIDMITIDGVADMAKRIKIEADSNGVINSADPINNFQIILSRNHGFIQAIDLFTFPYHRPDSINVHSEFFDYYFDLIVGEVHGTADASCYLGTARADTANSIFRRVAFYNPTQSEVYNFATGDIFETVDKLTTYYTAGAHIATTTTLDTIVSKSVTPYFTDYTIARQSVSNEVTSYGSASSINTYGSETIHADTSLLVDMRTLPEEWRSGYVVYYLPSHNFITTSACFANVYTVRHTPIDYASAKVVFQVDAYGDGATWLGDDDVTYTAGYGQTRTNYFNHTLYGHGHDKRLIYAKKDGNACGNVTILPPVAIMKTEAGVNELKLFPNPTSSELNISAKGIIKKVVITDIAGRKLLIKNNSNMQVSIDISSLQPGIYLVRINDIETRKFVKE